MRILIAGGSGLIGHELSRGLIQAGDEVLILSRNPSRVTGMPKGTVIIKWDVMDVNHWRDEIENTDVVINLTGENISGENFIPARWTEQRKARLLKSRVDSGKVLSRAIELSKRKPNAFIQASGINYYDITDMEPATEESSGSNDFLANLSKEWEASSSAVEAWGVRRIVIRSGVVLSKHGGALPRLLFPYRFFIGGRLGSGKQIYSWIHIQDEVDAIIYLAKKNDAQGIFNLTSPYPVSNEEFGKTISQVMKRPHFLPIPGFLLQLALGEVSTVVLEGRAVLPTRLLAEGYEFKYPQLKEALENIIKFS